MRPNLVSKKEDELDFIDEGIKPRVLGVIAVLWYEMAFFWYKNYSDKSRFL